MVSAGLLVCLGMSAVKGEGCQRDVKDEGMLAAKEEDDAAESAKGMECLLF